MAASGDVRVRVRPAAQEKKEGQPLLEEKGGAGSPGDGGEATDADKPKRLSWSRLCAEARPVRCRLIVGTICLVFSSASNLAMPALFGGVIDALGRKDAEQLKFLILLLVATSAGGALFTFVRAYMFNSAGQIVVASLRSKLYNAILRQDVGFYDENKAGELLSRLASDTAVLKDAVTENISMGLRWGGMVIGGLVYLLVLSWELAVLLLGIFPVIGVAACIYGVFIRKLSKEQQKALAVASEVAEETFTGIRTVRSFVAEDSMSGKYQESIDRTLRAGISTAWANGIFFSSVSAITSCAFVGLLFYGGTLVLDGTVTEGTLTSFLLFAVQIGAALGGLAGLYGSMSAALGANERVFALLDREPAMPVSGSGLVPEEPFRGDVELEGVRFSYPSRPKVEVLSGLDLTMRPGEVHALVGSSGGGKSTVVNLIERFYDVKGGTVRVDGRDVRDLDPRWLRGGIGLVRQEPILFSCSIKENILFGNPLATDGEVRRAAEQANALEFIDSFPDGMDTVVGEKGVRLSGGQKQRVAIARAILRDPRILLLDEATSALDAESEHVVQVALDRVMEGRTVLVIAHRLSTVKDADRVHVVQDGRVVASGRHEALLRESELYAGLVRRQLSGLEAAGAPASDGGAAAE